MISSGSSFIYATKWKSTDDITLVMDKDLTTYDFIGEMNADLSVEQTNPNFCTNCTYVIAVQAFPDV